MKPWKKQHWHWERDNKQQTLKWVIFHWKYNIPTIQEALTPPGLLPFTPLQRCLHQLSPPVPDVQVLDMMGIIPLLFCNDTPRDEIPARAPVNHGGRASDECENVVLLQRFMHVSVCQRQNVVVYPEHPCMRLHLSSSAREPLEFLVCIKDFPTQAKRCKSPGQPHVACLSLWFKRTTTYAGTAPCFYILQLITVTSRLRARKRTKT